MLKPFRMRRFTIILLLFLGINVNNADLHAQWLQQQTQSDNNLFDVYFTDTNHGWVVGSNGTILHTTDGGNFWEAQKNGIPQNSNILSVHAFNREKCFAVGTASGDTSTIILKTTNGGISWIKDYFGVNFEVYWIPWSIIFTDSMLGWVIGEYTSSTSDSSFVLRTTDGGASWEKNYLHSFCDEYEIYAVDGQHAWVSCASGWIMKTINGSDWNRESYSGFGYYSLDFINQNIGWASMDGIAGSMLIKKTTDGGLTWTVQKSFACASVAFLSFPDAFHGWSVVSTCISGAIEVDRKSVV